MTTTTTKVFDPIVFKEQTRQEWQSAAKAWNDWGPTLRKWLGTATDVLLDTAHIGPGQRVLDVAAGAGEQSLAAARRVGSSGRVVATDISSDILVYAAENARRAGLSNVETRAIDAEKLDYDAAFDAVISRLGLSLFPDTQRALGGFRRSLARGGRVAAMVLSTPDANPFFALPLAILRRHADADLAFPTHPGPFGLGAPGALGEAFRRAGFANVEIKTISAPLKMVSASECARFERESFGTLRRITSILDPGKRDAVWREIEEKLRDYDASGSFCIPCELVLAVGVNA